MIPGRALACLSLLLLAAPAAASGAAYYVSPSGSDHSQGLSADAPFRTLERLRSALRASASIKTGYLLGGLYPREATLSLGAQDAGESWLGYPGQTPILEGAGRTDTAIAITAASVTVRGLTIRNFVGNGILARNAPGSVIDGDSVFHTLSTRWSQGAIHAANNFTGGRITRNLVRDAGYCGIIVDTKAGDDISGLLISGNAVYDTCKTIPDCGAIYADDRGHASRDIVISSNVIGGYGSPAMKSKGIYLDDELSNARVLNNVIYGSGRWALQIHGGDHDVIANNVFDISGAPALALYEDDTPGRNFGMSGNRFTCNIVYSTAPPPALLWEFHAWKKIQKPTVARNVYWDSRGYLPDSGAVVDAQPAIADPSFPDPAHGDYEHAPSLPFPGCGLRGIPLKLVGPVAETQP